MVTMYTPGGDELTLQVGDILESGEVLPGFRGLVEALPRAPATRA